MKFAKRGDRLIVKQEFDKDKIFVTKAGKTYNVYDAIQAANVDTDIVEVMKKYNLTEDKAAELMEERGGVQGIYKDICEMQKTAQTLPELMQVGKNAQELFDNLPLEVKSKYGNDLSKFLKDQKEQDEKQSEPVTQPKDEVTDNETK